MGSTQGALKPRQLSGDSVGIPPRNVNFKHDYLKNTRYMLDNNAFASGFIAVLSGFFPPGERFFVESVRHYRTQITDPKLQAEVSGFIGQEALHGREHERLNALFTDMGIKVSAADYAVKVGLSVLERCSPEQQLACTIFMEHFTAILGESLLLHSGFRAKCEPEGLKLWSWHAFEELEHKSVAFDVYTQVSNSHWHKFLAGPLVVATLLPALLVSFVQILAKDDQFKLKHIGAHIRGANLLFGRQGLFKRVPRRMPDFFKKDFHPKQDDTTALEAIWRQHLFGEQGMLSAEYKPRTH